jgi:hypothetical protein
MGHASDDPGEFGGPDDSGGWFSDNFGDVQGGLFGADFGGSVGGYVGIDDEFGPAGPGSKGSDLAGNFGDDFDGGGGIGNFLADLFARKDPRTEEGLMAAAAGPFAALVHIVAEIQRQFPDLEVVPIDPNAIQGGEENVTLRNSQGQRIVVGNSGVVSSDIPEIEADAEGSGQGFDISSLEGTFVPLGGGSGFNIDDLPPLVDPSTLTPGSEEALRAELAAITRASFEVSLEQRDLQRALLPQILRGAGANPILDDSGSLIGFEIPKGGFPVPPGIERDIASGRDTRREQLRRQLGPGFETSSPGIEALEEFELASTIARDMGRSSSLGRIQSALGLPIQSTQNIQGTGGGATSSLNAILGRSALDQRAEFNKARLALAGEDDDDLFGTIFGGLASGFGRGFGGAAFGGLFGP